MRALCWRGKKDVAIERVPDPKIINPRDAIIKITTTAICGSDLHLYDGYIPTHEGRRHPRPRVHGRGRRNREQRDESEEGRPRGGAVHHRLRRLLLLQETVLFAAATTRTRTPGWPRRSTGTAAAALFGYSHMYGGFAGGQAEYARVPFADVGPMKVPDSLPDEKVLFLTDIFPTGYMAAENCNIEPGDTVAVWGCGPVGLFAIKSAFMLGAARVIGIDSVEGRLQKARDLCGAETVNFEQVDLLDAARRRDRRARPGLVHRRGGDGGARQRHRRVHRHGEDENLPRHGPADGAADGDHGVSQGRNRDRSRACTAGCSTSCRWAPRSRRG